MTMSSLQKGGSAAGAAAGGISAIAQFTPTGSKAGGIAANALFTASTAANAIPVAGQFVSAGLAIAGLFTKIFAGRKKAKQEAARAAEQAKTANAAKQFKPMQQAGAGVGLAPNEPAGKTAPVYQPDQASFATWGGGQPPTVQQQAINHSIGMSK